MPGARCREVAQALADLSAADIRLAPRRYVRREGAAGTDDEPHAARLCSDRQRSRCPPAAPTRGVAAPVIEIRLAGACGAGRSGVDDTAQLTAVLRAVRASAITSMINVPAGARILLATRPVDFRKGAHGLAALAQEVLAEDPFSGAVIVYRAKRGDRVKILVWDTSGLVLIWKQLQQGSFRWPPVMDGVMKLSPVEFAALFDGLDWTRVQTMKNDSTTQRSPCRIRA